MTIDLPAGWTGFNGGGSDPDLCGEAGVPPTINTTPPGSELNCDDLSPTHEIDLEIVGGTPPFTWETTEGIVVVTGVRTATLKVADLWDPSVSLVIDNTSLNPCGLAAFVYRGSSIWAEHSPEPGTMPCNFKSCFGLHFNCKGELLAGGLQPHSGITGCNEENALFYEGNFEDASNDSGSTFWGFGSDYSNCSRYPDGWPLLCLSEEPDTSWLCFGEKPDCAQQDEPTARFYQTPGNCSMFTTPGVNGTGGIHTDPRGQLLANPTAGSFCDVRHPLIKANNGCSPCVIIKGQDIVVTVTDALGQQDIIVIHVN